VTEGNKTWYVPNLPRYGYDAGRARALLAGLGLADRNGDALLDDSMGRPVRFSLLTNRGNTIRERTVAVVQEHLRRIGITVDVTMLDPGAVAQRIGTKDYDAVYFGLDATSTDPAHNMDFWVSSGGFHVWHMRQQSPATEWERRIDELMRRQIATTDLSERQRLFAEVQRIFAENIPIIYFAAPRVFVGMSPRLINAQPAPLKPRVLWNADVLALRSGGTS
jgi:peptide/nickel transport system substrate-binding protein